jgi:hypothetical protein
MTEFMKHQRGLDGPNKPGNAEWSTPTRVPWRHRHPTFDVAQVTAPRVVRSGATRPESRGTIRRQSPTSRLRDPDTLTLHAVVVQERVPASQPEGAFIAGHHLTSNHPFERVRVRTEPRGEQMRRRRGNDGRLSLVHVGELRCEIGEPFDCFHCSIRRLDQHRYQRPPVSEEWHLQPTPRRLHRG